MKRRLSTSATLFIWFIILLLLLPVAVAFMTPEVQLSVHAEEAGAGEDFKEEIKQDGTQEETQPDTETDTETDAEQDTKPENDSLSGNEIPKEEAKCICGDLCQEQSVNKTCEVCKEKYSLCAYVMPNVKISIETPKGWHSSNTKVNVKVEDLVDSGNFKIQLVQAKISQNGSWMDITEEMKIEISENSNIYVLVTDQKGKTYEKNRYVKCFDYNKPSLNAAVNDGLLSIKAQDTEAGVKAVYVNGHEFKELTDGVLSIRLQQFDAGYQYFTIQAMDHAGNISEVYKIKNPYYTDPDVKDNNSENPAEKLPISAEATKPTTSTGQVTEHIKTDANGNTTSDKGSKEDTKDAESTEDVQTEKEFYTIETQNGKVFYLIIERSGEGEIVHFLTEISENDLLNATSDNHEVLPQNSAAVEAAIPILDDVMEEAEAELPDENTEEAVTEDSRESQGGFYVILGLFFMLAIGAGYYFKVVKPKEAEIPEEDDEEEEEFMEEEEEDEEFLEKS